MSSDWQAATHARSAEVARSRHPGRYPKLEGSTLSHPAFEPLTEHHAFTTGLFDRAHARSISLRDRTMLSVCWAARRVSQSSELRTWSILPFLHRELQVLRGRFRVESARESTGRRGAGDHGVSDATTHSAAWLPRRRPTWAASQTLHSDRESIGQSACGERDGTPAIWPAGIRG